MPLSGGRTESARRGASGMDAARELGVPAIKGQGWPLYAGPRSADGVREVERSETRMQGQAFLLTFFGAGRPAFGKSESPSRAKPMLPPDGPVECERGAKASEAPCKAQTVVPAEESAALTYRNPRRRPSRPRPPPQALTSTTTPSTPAGSPPAAAAPPHSPAQYSGRCRSAAARTAPAPRASPPAAGPRPCRSPPR